MIVQIYRYIPDMYDTPDIDQWEKIGSVMHKRAANQYLKKLRSNKPALFEPMVTPVGYIYPVFKMMDGDIVRWSSDGRY